MNEMNPFQILNFSIYKFSHELNIFISSYLAILYATLFQPNYEV